MTLALTPQMAEMLNRKVASGRYTSAGEVLIEALRLLDERDQRRERRVSDLRMQIDVGMDQLARGEYTEYDEASLDRLVDEITAEDSSAAR